MVSSKNVSKISNPFYILLFYDQIKWNSSRDIYCNSICQICLYAIRCISNFIAHNYWITKILFKYLLFSQIYVLGFQLKYIFVGTIAFKLALTFIIVPFLIWMSCFAIEFIFTITWNMFYQRFNLIYSWYHTKYSNIYVFLFCLKHAFFVDKSSTTLQLSLYLSSLIMNW